MKKAIKILSLLCLAIICAFGVFACGGDSESYAAPQNVKVTGGSLKWDKVEGAKGYKISADGITFSEITDKVSVDVFLYVTDVNTTKVFVKAVFDNGESEASSCDVKCEKLDAPTKPYVTEDPITHAIAIAWEEVDGAQKYSVNVNGAAKWSTYSKNEYAPARDGDYVIQVKSKGYQKGDILYLDSDPSPKSDTIPYHSGPSLTYDKLNNLGWTIEKDFDQYDLYYKLPIWEEFILLKEDVKLDEEEYFDITQKIDGEQVLAYTGEFDFILKATMDAKEGEEGYTVWSNALYQCGTGNIKDHEVYSFDNRKVNYASMSNGFSYEITDEKCYSEYEDAEGEYSMKVKTSGQFNMMGYGLPQTITVDGVTVPYDLKNIHSLTYWIYVDVPDGFAGYKVDGDPNVYVNYAYLPQITNDHWEIGGLRSRYCSRPVEEFLGGHDYIPANQWVQLRIDYATRYGGGVNSPWGILVWIFNNPGFNAQYIDEIQYLDEGVDVDVNDDVYSTYVAHGAQWYDSLGTKVFVGEEYANQTVKVSMDMKVKSGSEVFSLAYMSYDFSSQAEINAHKDDAGNVSVPIGFVKRSVSAADYADFANITFQVPVLSDGSIYLCAANWDAPGISGASYDVGIYIKKDSVEVVNSKISERSIKSNDKYCADFIIIPVEGPGKYDVSMSILTAQYSDQWFSAGAYAVSTFWSDGSVKDKTTILTNDQITGDWQDIMFTADAVNQPVIKYVADKAGQYTCNEITAPEGYYILFAIYNKSDVNGVAEYRDVEVSVHKNTIPTEGVASRSTASNGYIMDVLFIPVENPAEYTVTMKVKLPTYTDQYVNPALGIVTEQWGTVGTTKSSTTLLKVGTANGLTDGTVTGDWQEITFTTNATSFTKACIHDNESPITTFAPYSILLTFGQTKGAVMEYKDLVVTPVVD